MKEKDPSEENVKEVGIVSASPSQKKHIFTNIDLLFAATCFLIVLFCVFFIFSSHGFIKKSIPFVVLPDLVSFLPAFSGGFLIAIWFLLRGKSIKNINDFFLFFFAAYVVYLLIYDYPKSREINSIEYLANSLNHLFVRVFILMNSIGKCLIVLVESIFEFKKEESGSEHDLQGELKALFNKPRTVAWSLLIVIVLNSIPFIIYFTFY
ncbi:hypothetical protein N7605_08500 [Pantoea ananatis]|uniref:hypothetical protein n=1 Tax=Pantoea ananas TaxID=553 RepID=UPI00287E5A71|nr:hypothetical protein [Pantoea ananatis]MDS7719864.1 hypothetical protein [Pantoea ananatis]